MNAFIRSRKYLLALVLAATSAPSLATEKDVSRMIDALPNQVQADLLAGTPAQNITLDDGSNLAKNLASVLTTTPQLGYRAMDACELPRLNVAAGVDGVLNVRNVCGIPATAKAVALHVQLVPVETICCTEGEKSASVAKLLLENPYVYVRASDVPFSTTSRALAYNEHESIVYTSRLCVSGCSSELKVRSDFAGSYRFTVVGFYEDVTTIVGPRGDKGDKGDQGTQGIQGLTGAMGQQGVKGDQGIQGQQGPPGAAVAVTLACFNAGTDYLACSSACGSGTVIQNQSALVAGGSCTVVEGAASCSRTAGASGVAVCCACRRVFN